MTTSSGRPDDRKTTRCPVCETQLDHLISYRRRFPYDVKCTACKSILQAFDDTLTTRVAIGILASVVAGAAYLVGAVLFPSWALLPWFFFSVTVTLFATRILARRWLDVRVRLVVRESSRKEESGTDSAGAVESSRIDE